MSVTPDSEIRTNHLGQPCPTWCTANHDLLLIEGKAEFGFLDLHNSDYMASGGAVVLSRLQRETETKVRLTGPRMIRLTPEDAESLAQILEDRHSLSGIASLIDELRTAAQIARDTK